MQCWIYVNIYAWNMICTFVAWPARKQMIEEVVTSEIPKQFDFYYILILKFLTPIYITSQFWSLKYWYFK